MQKQQGVALRRIGKFTLQPFKLKVAQFTMRYAKNLAIQQQDLPLIADKHAFGRGDPRFLQRAVHRGLKVMVTRQPNARRAKACDTFSKVLIGRSRLILR